MGKNKAAVAALLLFLFATVAPCAFADIFLTDGTFNLRFVAGEAFTVCSSDPSATVTFNVTYGVLDATSAQLFVSNSSGSLTFFSSANGNFTVSTVGNIIVSVGGSAYTGEVSLSNGEYCAVTWVYNAAPIIDDAAALFIIGVAVACVFVAIIVMRRKI